MKLKKTRCSFLVRLQLSFILESNIERLKYSSMKQGMSCKNDINNFFMRIWRTDLHHFVYIIKSNLKKYMA